MKFQAGFLVAIAILIVSVAEASDCSPYAGCEDCLAKNSTCTYCYNPAFEMGACQKDATCPNDAPVKIAEGSKECKAQISCEECIKKTDHKWCTLEIKPSKEKFYKCVPTSEDCESETATAKMTSSKKCSGAVKQTSIFLTPILLGVWLMTKSF